MFGIHHDPGAWILTHASFPTLYTYKCSRTAIPYLCTTNCQRLCDMLLDHLDADPQARSDWWIAHVVKAAEHEDLLTLGRQEAHGLHQSIELLFPEDPVVRGRGIT